MEHYSQIRELIDRVRRRWRTLTALRAALRASIAAAAVVTVALAATRWTTGAPIALIVVALLAAALVVTAFVICLWPLRRGPHDTAVARFIEEREPALDDRLVSAVDLARGRASAGLADALMADTARRTARVDVDAIVPAHTLQRAAVQAIAAAIALAIVLFAARGPAREAADAASLTLFPAKVALDVRPGNARVKAGTPLAIEARLVGNRAPVVAQLQIADGDRWRITDMAGDKGAFSLAMPSVTAGFTYRVAAGAVTSPTYEI